jgi:hypothetical protein
VGFHKKKKFTEMFATLNFGLECRIISTMNYHVF